MYIKIFLFKICRIYREKEMTLPKGYKPNTPSSDDDDDRPTGRPRKKGSWGKAIFFFILFLISLYITYHLYLNYVESGKELDEQKKVVEKSKLAYEEAFKDVYGRYPIYPSEYPPKTPP
jgi:hypothetical protein